MADKFPYLARQINGPLAKNFGLAIDHIYEKDLPFINFLSSFSLDTLEGDWLDQLGTILGLPRPYVTVPVLSEAFQFDVPLQMLDGMEHGFSSATTITVNGETYSRNQGGLLDNIYRDTVTVPVTDNQYRKYLRAACAVKKRHSISGIADVVQVFVSSSRYAISFLNTGDYHNDIRITLAANLQDHQETLQNAFNQMFTTSPRIYVDVDLLFDEVYLKQPMEQMVYEITGSTAFQITYTYVDSKVVFSVVLDTSLSAYEQDVIDALDEEYGEDEDIEINVSVESLNP